MILTRSAAAMAAAAVMALGAGCAGSDSVISGSGKPSPEPADNGVSQLSARQILSRSQAALKKASSVHLKGRVVSDGESFDIDLRMSDRAGGGTMTQGGQTLQLLRIGRTVYIKADADFWRTQTGNAAAAQLLQGKYLKGTTSDPSVASMAAFTDADKFVAQLLSPQRNVTKGAKKAIRGREAVALIEPGKDGGTMYIATRGEPYPLRLTSNTPSEPGAIDFLDYGASVSFEAPPADQVVDTSKLTGN